MTTNYRHLVLDARSVTLDTVKNLRAEFTRETPWCIVLEGWESFRDLSRPWLTTEPQFLASFLNMAEDEGHYANVVSRHTHAHDDDQGEFFRALVEIFGPDTLLTK